MGRPNKYYTNVEPRLKDIERMALTMTEQQIATCLGVGKSAWCEYKKRYPALMESIKKGRESLVNELKSALIKKAKGFTYTEKSELYELSLDGSEELILTKREVKTKHAAPDVAAINLLLKNYDRDNWSNDPQMIEIRKKELELREKQIEANEW